MILLYSACFSGIARLFPPCGSGIAGGLLTAVLALPFHAAICLRTGG